MILIVIRNEETEQTYFLYLVDFLLTMLVVRVTIFSRLTTEQNLMKKAKYLIFDRIEIVLKSGNIVKPTFAANRKFICYAQAIKI